MVSRHSSSVFVSTRNLHIRNRTELVLCGRTRSLRPSSLMQHGSRALRGLVTVSISQSFNMPTNDPHDLLVAITFPQVSNYLRTTAIEKYSYQGCMFDDVPRSGNQAIPVPKVLEIRCWTGSPACKGISNPFACVD